ncbi:MAG: class I SAM-dependent methyltransferase [Solirubrobacterales bacterium]|nr:class I SAM-dependent methyltransferase [Solirubrobacterales bacterium]
MDKRLIEKHGAAAEEFLTEAAQGTDRQRLYALKNATGELSADITRLWSGALLAEQIPWLRALVKELAPSAVLDLGCEQGLVTRAIAQAAPEAELRAVDRCEEAVAIAVADATKWDSPAPKFHIGDLRDPWHAEWASGRMDFVHSSRSMLGEVVVPDAELPREVSLGIGAPSAEWLREARALAGRIAAATRVGGVLVSLERTDATGALRWARVLAENGFQLDSARSRLFDAPEPNDADLQLPCLVFTMLDGAAPNPTARELITALLDVPKGSGSWTGFSAERLIACSEPLSKTTSWGWAEGDERVDLVTLDSGEVLEARMSCLGGATAWLHPAGSEGAVTERIERELTALLGSAPEQVSSLTGS